MKRFSVVLLILFLGLSACTKQIQSRPVVSQQDASLADLISLYKQRLSLKTGLKALITVDGDFGKRGRHRFQSAWISRKDAIEIRGFSFFGQTLFELNLDDETFSFYIPAEKKAFEGDLAFFESAAGGEIPFGSLDLLVWVKRGGIPNIDAHFIPMLEKRDDVFLLYLFSMHADHAILEEKVFIERSAFRVERVELFDPAGHRRGVITFGDYRKVDENEMPFSVKATGGGEEIELTFGEVSFPQIGPEQP